MNKVFLIGNLTRAPELSTVNSDIPVCKFGVAVSRPSVNRQSGERGVDFFNVTAWRKLGEICHKYLSKGKKVCVTGKIETRTYEQDGMKKSAFDIIAADVKFLSPSEKNGQNGDANKETAPNIPPAPDDEDLPF